MGKPKPAPCRTRAYHVDRNTAHDRCDVVDKGGRLIGHRQGLTGAIDFAVGAAQHSHGKGAAVCVVQPDGGYTLAWSSP